MLLLTILFRCLLKLVLWQPRFLSKIFGDLRFYQKYCDDDDFRWPLKARHRDDAKVVRDSGKRDRDLPPEQFALVRDPIRNLYGQQWASLFTVQWREALRISEAAALHWEDVHLDFKNPECSYIRVCRHVEWTRKSSGESRITDGFKNSKALGGVKELPLFPEAFDALKELYYIGAKGLVFKDEAGSFFSFRCIQHRYERAFVKAGLPFTGTHTLRHGGCRAIYNETGDVALAGMLLGNEDSDTVKVYARRDKKALQKLAQVHWSRVAVAPQ
jgi:integrase